MKSIVFQAGMDATTPGGGAEGKAEGEGKRLSVAGHVLLLHPGSSYTGVFRW